MNEQKVALKERLQEALNIRGKKAADLSKDLNIPKSAVSQYLSGKSQKMDSKRLFLICEYLNVSEPWMLGFNVTMEREMQKKNDIMTDIVVRMRTDSNFFSLVEKLNDLDEKQIIGVSQMLSTFIK